MRTNRLFFWIAAGLTTTSSATPRAYISDTHLIPALDEAVEGLSVSSCLLNRAARCQDEGAMPAEGHLRRQEYGTAPTDLRWFIQRDAPGEMMGVPERLENTKFLADPSGLEVSAFKAVLTRTGCKQTVDGLVLRVDGRPAAGVGVQGWFHERVRSATTDPQGKFRLEDVCTAGLRVAAWSPTLGASSVWAGRAGQDVREPLRLVFSTPSPVPPPSPRTPRRLLSGTAKVDGRGVAGAQIEVYALPTQDAAVSLQTAQTAKNGAFELQVPDGRDLLVRLHATGMAEWRALVPAEDKEPLAAKLQPGEASAVPLAGLGLMPTDEGAQVVYLTRSVREQLGGGAMVLTGADVLLKVGEVPLKGLPVSLAAELLLPTAQREGNWPIAVSRDGYLIDLAKAPGPVR